MADINRGNRPLSPHLQVYRLPLAAITSILTRITGHALVAGILLFVWWIVAAATSDNAFYYADSVMRSWFGFIVMVGSMWALWYHLVAGVRHLFYDAGHLMTIEEAKQASWIVIIASVVLAVITLILFFVV